MTAGGGPDRSAWCYGSAGVARALWLAGVARDRADWRGLAVEAMRGVCERPVYARMLDSPTFCHGVSGLLQVTLRFGHDTGLPVFADAAALLTERLLGMHEPGTLAGYRGVELGGQRVRLPWPARRRGWFRDRPAGRRDWCLSHMGPGFPSGLR